MAKLGYCGRIVVVLKKNHTEYALVNSGGDYYYLTKCEFEKNLNQYLEDTDENSVYNLWYDKDFVCG